MAALATSLPWRGWPTGLPRSRVHSRTGWAQPLILFGSGFARCRSTGNRGGDISIPWRSRSSAWHGGLVPGQAAVGRPGAAPECARLPAGLRHPGAPVPGQMGEYVAGWIWHMNAFPLLVVVSWWLRQWYLRLPLRGSWHPRRMLRIVGVLVASFLVLVDDPRNPNPVCGARVLDLSQRLAKGADLEAARARWGTSSGG